jgi:hypothetical protein
VEGPLIPSDYLPNLWNYSEGFDFDRVGEERRFEEKGDDVAEDAAYDNPGPTTESSESSSSPVVQNRTGTGITFQTILQSILGALAKKEKQERQEKQAKQTMVDTETETIGTKESDTTAKRLPEGQTLTNNDNDIADPVNGKWAENGKGIPLIQINNLSPDNELPHLPDKTDSVFKVNAPKLHQRDTT